jgi:hypothetical protein
LRRCHSELVSVFRKIRTGKAKPSRVSGVDVSGSSAKGVKRSGNALPSLAGRWMTPDCSFAVQSARCAENVLIDKLGGNIEGLNARASTNSPLGWRITNSVGRRRRALLSFAHLRAALRAGGLPPSAQPSALYVFKSGATLVPRCALGWYGSGPLASGRARFCPCTVASYSQAKSGAAS